MRNPRPAARVSPKKETILMSKHLQNFPISFFAVIMGLAGATIAWQRAESLLRWPSYLSTVLLWVSALVFLAILMIYIAKYYKYPDEFKKELESDERPAQGHQL
jgi:tellurite resistance protein